MPMWPYGSTNPMTAKFQAAKEQAANLTQPGERGAYTEEMFREDFPQFTKKVTPENDGDPETQDLLPKGILQMFLDQVNMVKLVTDIIIMQNYTQEWEMQNLC